MTPFEITWSTESSARGIASISPSRVSTLSSPASAAARGALEHLREEVETDHPSGGTRAPSSENRVDPATAAQVQDRLAGRDLGEPQVVGDAECAIDGSLRHLGELLGRVELERDVGRLRVDAAVRPAHDRLDLVRVHEIARHGSPARRGSS